MRTQYSRVYKCNDQNNYLKVQEVTATDIIQKNLDCTTKRQKAIYS